MAMEVGVLVVSRERYGIDREGADALLGAAADRGADTVPGKAALAKERGKMELLEGDACCVEPIPAPALR